MKPTDAAAAAAAARAAELARIREAERRAAEAAKKAAEAAAKKAAQQQAAQAAKKKPSQAEVKQQQAELSAKAKTKATASGVRQAFGKDEISQGMGQALRTRASTLLASPFGPPAPSAPPMKPLTVQGAKTYGPPAPTTTRPAGSPDSIERNSAATAASRSVTQGKADAAQVQKAYDDSLKANNGNEARASEAATSKMVELTRAHKGDVAYSRSLVAASQPTLDKIATAAGKNANGEAYYKDGDDDEAIKRSMVNLSDVAAASGQLGTYQIADTLAKKLPNRDELEAVDDGFYRAMDDGHSDALFKATAQRMVGLGKKTGAEELVDRGGGGFSLNPLDHLGDLVDVVKDLGGDLIGAVGDAGSAVVDVAGKGLHVISEAGEFVVDAAKGTVGLAKDLADATLDEVKGAVKYAVEQGLELAGNVRDFLRSKALEVTGKAVGKIGDLEPGESVDLHADVDVSLGLSVGVNGSVSVAKNEDGSFTVAGQVGADFGFAAEGEGEAGLAGRVEMKFATADEAKKAAEKLLLMGASGVSPVLMPVLAPSPSELKDMMQHVSAVELTGSAAAEIQGLPADDGLKGEVGVSTSYRMEFENGKPVALVRKSELNGELNASLPKEVTQALKASGLNLNVGADFKGSVSLETRIPLSGDLGGKDLLAFIASPATAVVAGKAESSIHLEGSVDGSSTTGLASGPLTIGHTETQGTTVSLDISDIDASEVTSVFGKLIKGDFSHLTQGVDVNLSAGWEKWKEGTDGFEADFTIAGEGVEASAGRTRHDTLEEHSVDVALNDHGAKVTTK